MGLSYGVGMVGGLLKIKQGGLPLSPEKDMGVPLVGNCGGYPPLSSGTGGWACEAFHRRSFADGGG